MRRILLIALGAVAVAALFFLPSASGEGEGEYKVRAIFDNGSFLVPDEEVRIAGARVGLIESVDVSGDDEVVHADGSAEPGKAVIVLSIEDEGFQDFREDASCIVRPQSLIGERFVDCDPTQPRASSSPVPPELEEIPEGEPGEGQRLLPIESNGKSVDLDLVNNIYRAPYRDRFRIILNELGAGLAARGDDLGAIIDRANPALRNTDRVLKILADQSDQLASLASDGDTVLQPLAENRTSITGFFRNSTVAAQATAERGEDLELQFQKLPRTLREVRLTMRKLKGFADQGTPLMEDVGTAAPFLSKATQDFAPFARAGIPALTSLGDATEAAGPKLVATDPLLIDLRTLGNTAAPAAKNLQDLLVTFAKTKGFQHLMDFIYYSTASINGFDAFGHFLRAQVQLTACLEYEIAVFSGCEATFPKTTAQTEEAEKKKKKKKKKSTKSIVTPRSQQPPPAPAPPTAPTGPIPPIEEILPELDPPSSEDPAPGEPLPPADGQPDDPSTTDEQSKGDAPMTMQDASLFLSYLIGSGS